VGRMRSAGIHVADLPADASLQRKDRAWWKATGVPLLTRVRAKLGATAAGSGKVSAGMFDGHILRREESDTVVQHADFAVFEAAVGCGDFARARALLAVDRANEFGWLLQRAVLGFRDNVDVKVETHDYLRPRLNAALTAYARLEGAEVASVLKVKYPSVRQPFTEANIASLDGRQASARVPACF
jgi:hypothetical protein